MVLRSMAASLLLAALGLMTAGRGHAAESDAASEIESCADALYEALEAHETMMATD